MTAVLHFQKQAFGWQVEKFISLYNGLCFMCDRSCTCKTLVGVTPPCILPRQFVSLKQAQRQEQCGVGDRLVCIGGGRGFVVCAWKQGSSLFSTDSWPAFTFRGHIPVEPWMAVIVGRARQRPVQTGRHQHFRWSACWPVSTLSLLCAV